MTLQSSLVKIDQMMHLLAKTLPASYKIVYFDKRYFSDLAVYRSNALYAIIQTEINGSQFKDLELEKSKALFERVSSCRFFIVVKKDVCDILEKEDGEYFHYQEKSISKIINKITDGRFWEMYESELDVIKSRLEKYGLERFFSLIQKDENGPYYFQEDDTDSFFNSLLSSGKEFYSVYRYTSLASLFETLKNKSYRLNCIVGMNDPTEIDYFEDYVGPDYLRYLHEGKNDIFISSCSTLADDLTMWRLYGDNAKGVCIEFDVRGSDFGCVKNLVSYADKNGKNVKLNIVRDLIECGLDLRGLEKWKHFFKPYEYSIEKEYRVLLTKKYNENDEKRKWVITNNSSILNPVYDIDLDAKPISMKRIILGPKCPEREINKKQLEVMMKENGITGIKVCESKIMNYR